MAPRRDIGVARVQAVLPCSVRCYAYLASLRQGRCINQAAIRDFKSLWYAILNYKKKSVLAGQVSWQARVGSGHGAEGFYAYMVLCLPATRSQFLLETLRDIVPTLSDRKAARSEVSALSRNSDTQLRVCACWSI